MGFTGIWQWAIVLVLVLLLFARPGKISGILGDLGKGLRNFRSGMKDDDADEPKEIHDADDGEKIDDAGKKKKQKV